MDKRNRLYHLLKKKENIDPQVVVIKEEESPPLKQNLDLFEKPIQTQQRLKIKETQEKLEFMIQNELEPKAFLKKHDLTEQQRSRMVDWMIEIFKEYQSNPSTCSLAVSIMDYFCYKTQIYIEGKHLHLLGVTCIWLASKVNDVRVFSINDIVSISHNKLAKEEIIQHEQEILETTRFLEHHSTLYNFVTLLHLDIQQKLGTLPDHVFLQLLRVEQDKFQRISFYLSKQVLFSYVLLSGYKLSLLGCGVILLAAKIVKSKMKLSSKQLRDILSQSTGYKINLLNKQLQHLINYVQQFKQIFPGSANLSKYNKELEEEIMEYMKNMRNK